MQKRLKEAFEVARRLTYEEATKHATIMIVQLEPLLYSLGRCYGLYRWLFGKRKVKDRWEDGVSSLSLSGRLACLQGSVSIC